MHKRVLLIEDEPGIVEAIRFILSRNGWAVTCHGEGSDAVGLIRADPPDVVILDVMLPGRSGFDILRDLRADPATEALPVLMLSARSQAKDRDLALRLGASRFMAKPFSNTEVLDTMRDLAGE